MTKFQVRSKSLSEARFFFKSLGDKVWQIHTKTNKISPHVTISFFSNMSLVDLRNAVSETSNDNIMKYTLRKDSREIHLV